MGLKSDLEKALHYILHWNFFGVAGSLALGAALSVITLQQYVFGGILFALAGVWSLGHWWDSEFLREKRRIAKISRLPRARRIRSYETWVWTVVVSLLIVGVTLAGESWILNTKQSTEREDVYSRLVMNISPSGANGNLLEPSITITNDAIEDIGKHGVGCRVNQLTILNMHSPPIQRSPDERVPVIASGLRGNGESETFTNLCFSSDIVFKDFESIGFAATCVDVTFIMDYALEDQPKVPQSKPFRFFADRAHGGNWTQEPDRPRGQRSYCPYVLPPSGSAPGFP